MKLNIKRNHRPIILSANSQKKYFLAYKKAPHKYEIGTSTACAIIEFLYSYFTPYLKIGKIIYCSRKTLVLSNKRKVLKISLIDGHIVKTNMTKLNGERLDLVDFHYWRKRSPSEVKNIWLALHREVSHLHQKSQFHGDLHPGNILIDVKDGKVVLIDRLMPRQRSSGAYGYVPRGRRPTSNSGYMKRDLYALKKIKQLMLRGG